MNKLNKVIHEYFGVKLSNVWKAVKEEIPPLKPLFEEIEKEEYLPMDEALVELAEVEEERKEIDKELSKIMQKIGLAGYLRNEGSNERN